MQPLENKRTKLQGGVARAKLLLKRDVAWLPGYPIGTTDRDASGGLCVQWCSAVESTTADAPVWKIDGEHLRRAQMTMTKLRHHFPRALPKIVDDVDDWLGRVDYLLNLLKRAIHDGVPFGAADVLGHGVLPKRLTQEIIRLKSVHSTLSPFLNAITFCALSDRQFFRRESLAWIDQHASDLESLCGLHPKHPCELPITFFLMRDDLSPSLFKSITRCLCDPLIGECRWENIDGRINEMQGELKKAVKQNEFSVPAVSAEQSLGALVRTVLFQTVTERPKQRRRLFRFLELLVNQEMIDIAVDVQRKVNLSEQHIQRLLRRIKSRHKTIPVTKDERRQWNNNALVDLKIAPTKLASVKAMGQTLRGIKDYSDVTRQHQIDLLTLFPQEHAAMRVRLLAKWRNPWHGPTDRQGDFNRVAKQLTALVRRRGIAPSLRRHWYCYVDGAHSSDEFVLNTAWELPGKRKLAVRTVNLLETILYDRKLNLGHELLTSLVEFALATDDHALACSIVEHLAKQPDESYLATDLRLAIFFGDSPEEMARIVAALQKSCDLTDLATELQPLANDSRLKKIVATRLAENKLARLSSFATTACLLSDIGQALPKREVFLDPADWVDRYPIDYQAALKSLAEATPDAERIAESVLGKFFPSQAKIQSQIDALNSKLDGRVDPQEDPARMRRRLENLERRMTQKASVSPTRRDKLIDKLQRRTEDEILQRYTDQCRQQAAVATKDQFGLETFPADLLVPPLDQVLREINQLSKPMRELGMRLLLRSFQRTTRNFDDEPANEAFRRRMQSLGINMTPWLSDQVHHSAATADGTPYVLSFTRDAVDFLLMGFHFDTCLSPNSFNFYSTVANAVDLNKRVVYGKTAAGKVIGRCLFALNDTGIMLTYHRYSHDPKDGFSEAVDQFAKRLADQMQTTIGSGGNVSKLVAKKWYDDGPFNTSLHWYGEEGALDGIVDHVAPGQLLSELINMVGENVLKLRIVDVATDDRLRDRTDFLHSLLDRFGDKMNVRQSFTVAVNVESPRVSHRLLSQLRWSDMVRIVKRHQCGRCDVLHGIGDCKRVFRVLTNYHPSLALRAIRATRPIYIQDDLSETNKIRRKSLIEVHQQLGRQRMVEKLSTEPNA